MKDSRINKKKIIDTHVKLAEFGMGLFHTAKQTDDQPLPDDSSIHKYVFWTLQDGNKANASTSTSADSSIGSAVDYREYVPVVKYDLSQHDVWSDCDYEDGDLRTREAICACDQCLDGYFYDCLLKEETGGWLWHNDTTE